MTRLLTLLLALLPLALPLHAQFGADVDAKSKSSLVSEVSSIAPGRTFTVALHLEHPKGWHSYYRNSGGIEMPPEITWSLPDGFQAGPIQWPVPEVKSGEFGISFIYPEQVTLLVDIQAPAGLEIGSTATLQADANWQICEVGCIGEDGSFTLALPVTAESQVDATNAPLFQQARQKLPLALPDARFRAEASGEDTAVLRITPSEEIAELPSDFIPDQAYWKSAKTGGAIERDGKDILIRLPRAKANAFGDPIDQGNTISGIAIGTTPPLLIPETTIQAADSTPPPSAADSKAPQAKALSLGALLPILGGMFLGGLILNLMPCVFPVIGLKIMGFVQQAGEDRKKIALHGILFTVGVLASFAVLSLLLFLFKESFGYGDQLGEPWFVLPMMILMLLLGLNMFGVFEIGASATSIGSSLQSKSGLAGSFFSGTLATLIATPCSAPFLGAAIGAAVTLPALQFFPCFGAMAIGLSSPYLVLSAFPKLIESLPRPGAWMESFKQAMSFLLFATAGYLLWVYSDLVRMADMAFPLPIFGLCCIAIAAWIHGRWNLPHRSPRTRGIALLMIVIFAASGIFLAKPPTAPAANQTTATELVWETWSPKKVDELLAAGTPVYIDFTAKWCLTCRTNKQRAYTAEVIQLMQQKGVVALRADKTTPNPEIEVAIRSYGRAAIPVNVLLVPGKEPVILPELLSPDDLIQALNGL